MVLCNEFNVGTRIYAYDLVCPHLPALVLSFPLPPHFSSHVNKGHTGKTQPDCLPLYPFILLSGFPFLSTGSGMASLARPHMDAAACLIQNGLSLSIASLWVLRGFIVTNVHDHQQTQFAAFEICGSRICHMVRSSGSFVSLDEPRFAPDSSAH